MVSRGWKVAPLVASGLLCVMAAARAEAGGFCQVRIESILACNTGNEFDTRLRLLKRRLDSIFHYSSYRLMSRENRRISLGQPARFIIPGRRLLVIKPRRYHSGRVGMKVMLAENGRPLVGTEVLMHNSGLFLMGGPRHEEGFLIISIGARME